MHRAGCKGPWPDQSRPLTACRDLIWWVLESIDRDRCNEGDRGRGDDVVGSIIILIIEHFMKRQGMVVTAGGHGHWMTVIGGREVYGEWEAVMVSG